MDRRFPGRGGCSHSRRDRIHRAYARLGPVPGGTDFLLGGIHAGRTDALRGTCLPSRFLLGERIIVPGRTSVGERVCILIGAFVPVADRIRIPEPDPVCVPDPDLDPDDIVSVPEPDHVGVPDPDPDPDPDRIVPVPARIHADERAFVRIGIGFRVTEADAWWPGSVLRAVGSLRLGTKIRCQGGMR